jgi:two-component system OmpR family sensor kinase
VSVIVLRGHLLHRLEGQLLAATATAAKQVTAEQPVSQALTGSTYAVAVFNLRTLRSRLISGDAPEAGVVPTLVLAIGKDGLTQRAAEGRTFRLDPWGKYDLIAAVARAKHGNRLVIVAVPLDAVDDPVRRLVIGELITGGALILLLAMVGSLLISRGLAPLRKMARTAHRVAVGGDLSARMPEGPSEIGRLGIAINLMLDLIGEAFRDRWASEDRVRRFAADASHELRTPLSTIAGYAELYRAGAIPADELPTVMSKIEDEAMRMSRLVGELLELARLDRAATLALAETELAALAREIAADCGAVHPAFPVIVVTPPPPDASVWAVVDGARIRQVLVNLLANVRAHTPKGTPATVRLERVDDLVTIEVEDAGPGMSAEQVSRAFDRFHQGRERPSEGAGLGLSIVKAIVDAHGGQCRITSSPGHGTVFHIELPAAPRATSQ